MPAKTFFAVLNQGIKIDAYSRNSFLYDLVDVASCAQAIPDWIDKKQNEYKARMDFYFETEEVKPPPKPTTVEHQNAVAGSLRELFKLKAQVEGLGG